MPVAPAITVLTSFLANILAGTFIAKKEQELLDGKKNFRQI